MIDGFILYPLNRDFLEGKTKSPAYLSSVGGWSCGFIFFVIPMFLVGVILLYYSAIQPITVTIVDNTPSVTVTTILGILMTLSALIIGYGFLRSWYRAHNLRRNGQVVLGRIANVTSKYDYDVDYYITLTISFYTPDTHQLITQENDYLYVKELPLPKIGTTVYLFYHNPHHWDLL